MVGVLLNHMFDPVARNSQLFDKDFVGNKRMEVCGALLGQQIRNALYRMRGFVTHGGMTAKNKNKIPPCAPERNIATSRTSSSSRSPRTPRR